MNKKTITQIFFACFFALFFSGCAKNNAAFIKQGYHDLTARYNSNFNAKQKYMLSIKSIENTRKDNYDELIPLYAYGTLKDTEAQSSAFDIVVDKASTSIQLHKISNWSDDNFLLLAKAFYMQGSYDKSIESLRYITANFKNGVDSRSDKKIKRQKRNKKRKKRAKKILRKNVQKLKEGKDIRPKKSFFKHQPTKSEALVWLVKAFTAKEQYNEAQAVLDYIALDNTFIQNYDRDKELAHANYLIQQNLFSEAIPHISKALEMFKSNKKKARYRFVIAQLFETKGDKTAARNYYELSKKGNSNYDMVFNATLKILKLSSANKNTDKEDKLLAKLIRDSKNVDYLDQLYYERALIAQKNKDLDKAKEYLALSIEKSTSNNLQKAKSYVLLANIFYADEDYTNAQENYAASLTLINPEFKDYNIISKRANVLTALVTQLNTISKNDSLLTFAELPKDKLEQLLYNQALAQIENIESAKNTNAPIQDKFAANDKKVTDIKFYFYSEQAKTQGYAKFINIFGNRKLEDDWRRSNKSSGLDFAEETRTEEEIFDEKVNELYEKLLAEIPNSDSSKTAMKDNVGLAHYTAANIYKYDLTNDPKAIYHYKIISNDFAESKYDAESLYNLYILNKEIDKKTSDKSKNLVLSKYPKSKFAKIIKDPSFAENLKKDNLKVDEFYEQTYEAYIAENYRDVLIRVNKSRTEFGENPLEAKFALLEAITLGKQQKYKPYVDALEAVIANYSNTIEQEKASEMLAYLKGETPPSTKKEETTVKTEEKATKKQEENSSIFNADKGKDKEGFKVNFGKSEILKVGTNDKKEPSKLENVNSKEIDKVKKP